MDIEGGELAAIEGLGVLLEQKSTKLVFEGGAELADRVRRIGYSRVSPLKRKEATEHALQNYCATWD
jgi:hypothetical protein